MNHKLTPLLLLVAACGFAIAQNPSEKTPKEHGAPRIVTGITEAGKTNWKVYKNKAEGIFVEVDTSDKKFTKTPNYVISIHGDDNHWNILGTASVYDPTPKGFKVYLRWKEGDDLTPGYANERNWRVAWIAVEE
jgi:hypothetical protein